MEQLRAVTQPRNAARFRQRLAHRAAEYTGETARFVEEASGPYTGQQSENIEGVGSIPDECEHCGCDDSPLTTATARVKRLKHAGYDLRRLALCVECFNAAVADDALR